MKSNKKYLYVNNIPVEVSQEVYKAYWQEVEKERYLEKISRERWIYLDHYFDGYESNSLEFKLVSKIDRIKNERNTEKNDRLHAALDKLEQDEFLIMQLIYFEGWYQIEVAKKLKVSQQFMSKKHDNIIEKLRNLMNL